MTIKTHIHLSLLLLSTLLLLATCKPCDDPTNPECENYCDDWRNPDCFNFCIDSLNPSCPNYNPCFAEKQVSADFWIIEDESFFYPLRDTLYQESILVAATMILEAKSNISDWTYTWYVGARTYNGPKVALDITSASPDERIQIVLVVSGTPDTTCFPESDGRDTLVKWVVVKVPDDHLKAKWHGYRNGNFQDTVTLEFFRDPDPFGQLFVRGSVTDWNGDYPGMYQGSITFRKQLFVTVGGNRIRGLILRDPAKVGDFDSVRITYSFPGTDTFRIDGRRVR